MRSERNISLAVSIFMAIALALFLPALSIAGDLEPGSQPGPTMRTLDEIYKRVDNVTRYPQCDSMRFLDLQDGTVIDCRTGLIWMKDADCFGRQTWVSAKDWCHVLNGSVCGLTDDSSSGDWHLSTIEELKTLPNRAYANPALSNAVGNGQWTQGNAFNWVQSITYWSSTTKADDTSCAWAVQFSDGFIGYGPKYDKHYVWCVRGGR